MSGPDDIKNEIMSCSRSFKGILLPLDSLFSKFAQRVRGPIFSDHLNLGRAQSSGRKGNARYSRTAN
jgi:hypothetical protein